MPQLMPLQWMISNIFISLFLLILIFLYNFNLNMFSKPNLEGGSMSHLWCW